MSLFGLPCFPPFYVQWWHIRLVISLWHKFCNLRFIDKKFLNNHYSGMTLHGNWFTGVHIFIYHYYRIIFSIGSLLTVTADTKHMPLTVKNASCSSQSLIFMIPFPLYLAKMNWWMDSHLTLGIHVKCLYWHSGELIHCISHHNIQQPYLQ